MSDLNGVREESRDGGNVATEDHRKDAATRYVLMELFEVVNNLPCAAQPVHLGQNVVPQSIQQKYLKYAIRKAVREIQEIARKG